MMWQPIVTAPKKEGNRLLGYLEGRPLFFFGWTTFYYPQGEWHGEDGSGYRVTPTHWMPLPDPPLDTPGEKP